MKFWEFDVCELIKSAPEIKRTLEVIQRQINLADNMVEHPVWGERGEWQLFREILKIREAEYQCYAIMIRNGMQDLPEIERMVIEMWLQEGYDDDYIVEHCKIKSLTELNKIKKIAISKFCKIAMP